MPGPHPVQILIRGHTDMFAEDPQQMEFGQPHLLGKLFLANHRMVAGFNEADGLPDRRRPFRGMMRSACGQPAQFHQELVEQ
ncbi:hypothetical protein D3C73_1447160 [compost metagenome]